MKNSFNTLGFFVLPVVLGGYACSEKKAGNNERPNILYIMTDDHSYQTISAYGHPLSRLAPTPNIDRLAEKGMLFNRAFVENSLSTPSRACLMTGLYSHQNGQRTLEKGIDSTKTFFTELLQESGYQTAVFGKWHIQCDPKGFDSYKILEGQGEYYNPEFRTETSNGKYIKENGYATTLITDYALNFLEKRDKEKPFCLLVHHKAPHRNWMPEPKYLNLFEDVEFPLPGTFYDDYATRCSPAHTQEMSIEKNMTYVYDLKMIELKDTEPYSCGWNDGIQHSLNRMDSTQLAAWHAAYHPRNQEFIENGLKKYSEKELLNWKFQRYLRDYLRCIKSIDDQVGRLIDYLEKENLMENTIVVYTSDQGFYMGEHGWFDKRFMYEESFRTPLIISYPKRIKAGTTTDALVQNIDYAPTFLSLGGIEKLPEMSGTTLEPLFDGKKAEGWRVGLYYHYYDYPAVHAVRRHDGVRTDRYKLIHFYGEGMMNDDYEIDCNEFYDLENDPDELNNLYSDPEYADVVSEIQDMLDNFREELEVDEF